MVEQVDTRDLKSLGGNPIRVRFPFSALKRIITMHALTEKEIKNLSKGDKLKVLSSYCIAYAVYNDIVTYIETHEYVHPYDGYTFYSIECKNKKGEIFAWSARRFALLSKEE